MVNMPKKLLNIVVLAGLMATLGTPVWADDGEFAGTVIGAWVGGFLGSMVGHGDGRMAATGAGIVLGGIVGNELARSSNESGYVRPVYYANNYAYDMFPPQNYYVPYQPNYVAPAAPPSPPPMTYIDNDSGLYCREFSQTVRVGNKTNESYGTACLQPDGSWHVVR